MNTATLVNTGVGLIVKEKRKALGLSQTRLAKQSRGLVTQAMVCRIEQGQDNVTLETLRGIAIALGCATVDLMPLEDKLSRSRDA